MELTSDDKDVTSPVCRGVSQKILRPEVWRTSKMNEDEDVSQCDQFLYYNRSASCL